MPSFSTIEAAGLDPAASYRLITSCVLPRPIAWISTRGEDGVVNVAPFSSYNYIAHTPPMVAVNIASRRDVLKDTARNIVATGEFVINVPDEACLDMVNLTSAEHAPHESEAEVHGLALLPSHFVKPPRIAMTPIQLECRLNQVVKLGEGINRLYIADVVAFHIDDSIFDGRYIDVEKLRPIVRLAGPHYAGLGPIVRREPIFLAPGTPNEETAP